ncbi:tyrosine-type recombinase/integrase [Natronospira bacteriovora]|uniref:Integrase arm-type DNA-binding domain-containing protein n=1 Tax=Natronospira bacteriovora TaxID=3069753 RepID=A0ABU0W5H6_9GAMM|nr:site-specific integrase [Natronospira sp. AB-CW4]MDQ2069194.1 integrase arm-type DNA-binding domain-containing protein [Natronospira sp. AB-CW4]
MARKGISAKKLDNLEGKRRDSATRLWDGDGSGFGVKVSAAGRLSFFQFYYAPEGTTDKDGNDISGKRRFLTLGTYPAMTLGEARTAALKQRKLVDQGVDPQEHAREQREQARRENRKRAERGTLAGVAALYMRHMRSRARSREYIDAVRRGWHRDVFPVVSRETKAAEVTAEDIQLILHRPLSRNAEHTARVLRANLHKAFKLAIQADHDPRNLGNPIKFKVTHNPVADVPLEVHVTPGDRELSFDEIGRVWREVDRATPYPSDALLIRLLLALGGQHVREVREADWAEFDLAGRQWLMKAARHKNRTRDHLVPLNHCALEVLDELRILTGGRGYLFPQVRRLEKPMRAERPGVIVRALLDDMEKRGEPMDKFTAADFRRTCKTRMHEIGIPKTTTNQIHNHDFGGVSAKHYDRYDYWAEKQRAMTAWDIALRAAIKGKSISTAACRRALQWTEAGSEIEPISMEGRA